MRNNRLIGAKAEMLACDFLEKQGFEIVIRNFRCVYGEIDVIVRDQEYMVFVEVKYRKNLRFGYPREAVSKAKQATIRNVALFYIQNHEQMLKNPAFRFDVIEILGKEIHHIVNAF